MTFTTVTTLLLICALPLYCKTQSTLGHDLTDLSQYENTMDDVYTGPKVTHTGSSDEETLVELKRNKKDEESFKKKGKQQNKGKNDILGVPEFFKINIPAITGIYPHLKPKIQRMNTHLANIKRITSNNDNIDLDIFNFKNFNPYSVENKIKAGLIISRALALWRDINDVLGPSVPASDSKGQDEWHTTPDKINITPFESDKKVKNLTLVWQNLKRIVLPIHDLLQNVQNTFIDGKNFEKYTGNPY